jgi:queuine/archaeosine tRNA-ribosyltransferase
VWLMREARAAIVEGRFDAWSREWRERVRRKL